MLGWLRFDRPKQQYHRRAVRQRRLTVAADADLELETRARDVAWKNATGRRAVTKVFGDARQ